MAENVSDEAFARAVQQLGAVTLEQIDAAKEVQAESVKKGVLVSLADVLVQQGLIPAAMQEDVEKKLQAQQVGGVQVLGQYKLLRKLGEIGMGTLYLADDLNLGRKAGFRVRGEP